METVTVKHFHLFCGLGGGAKGFNQSKASVGSMNAKFECIGGIDVEEKAIEDFGQLAGVPGTVLDLFSRDQYIRFHGKEPPLGWKEVTPEDIRKAANYQCPDVIFTSPPCKGFSGLLSANKAKLDKYQALNELTVRGFWLCMEAFKDMTPNHSFVQDPNQVVDGLPPFFIMENVPRIQSRGSELLDQIETLLEHYGYAVARTTHDVGAIGHLGQSRKRFLLVARHKQKIPPFLYEPAERGLRSVGSVLDKLPLPGDIETAGPMHEVPSLQWKTWMRLAFVEAGSDWRSLERLQVEDGYLKDYLVMPQHYGYGGILGVTPWENTACTVSGRNGATNGPYSVADPRFKGKHCYSQYGIQKWDETMGAVSGQSKPGGGKYSVADPRAKGNRWAGGKYKVTRHDQPAQTVIAASTTGEGAFAIQDVRTKMNRSKTDSYHTVHHYGVMKWDETAGVVSAAARHDNGCWSLADPRPIFQAPADALPAPEDNVVAVIESLDGTWHRPFTTLELAALQGMLGDEMYLLLSGKSHTEWRERIGNAVPPEAAMEIGSMMGETLLLALTGETFVLSALPIWVQPFAIATSTDLPCRHG